VFIGEKKLIRLIAVAGLSFALSVGAPSASRAEDDSAPAAAAADAKAAAKDAEPATTKDPQIALDDLELLLEPMTKEETETEAKGWYSLLRAKEREITVAELDVRRKNREIAQLEKQKTAASDLAKATEEVKATTSDKDKEAAAQHLAEAQKNLAQTVRPQARKPQRKRRRPRRPPPPWPNKPTRPLRRLRPLMPRRLRQA
jgi:small conductance mechanosensitive channel